jgi:hypothetical protein
MKNLKIFFNTDMSTTILQNIKLKFYLCMGKQK